MQVESRPGSGRAAILIFADAQQRDLRRRGLPLAAAGLLALPRLTALAPAADLHWFTDRPATAAAAAASKAGIALHRQHGRDFGERLENAVDTLAREGYDRIVILGRDCPQLTAGDVAEALSLLASRRLVVGPDHRGGCWLIALRAADRGLLRGIRWRQDTDAAALLARVARGESATLQVKYDLDDLHDLILLARRYLPAAGVLAAVAPPAAGDPSRLHPGRQAARVRIAQQLPPPRAA